MSGRARAAPAARARPSWWPRDPGGFALKGAVRAGLVVPVAFALGLVVIDRPQTALFAAFGSMGMLVFVDFGGPPRARLRAYAILAAAGLVLIPAATLLSETTVPAVLAMGVVAFVVIYAGVLDEHIAAAQSAAILAFVLPVMVPASASAIPERLLGWSLAAVLATSAALVLWPRRPRDIVRTQAGDACDAFAEAVSARVEGDDARAEARAREALDRLQAARRDFLAMQHRPSGTAGRSASLARLIDDLALLVRLAALPRADETVFAEHRRAIDLLAAKALHGSGAILRREGDADTLLDDVHALERCHQELGDAVIAFFSGVSSGAGDVTGEVDEGYRLRMLSFTIVEIATQALDCMGVRVDDPPWVALRSTAASRTGVVHAHATLRSVWLRNSLRGAVGLAAAVLVAEVADLDHAFWVVLGTMSVLRSNAMTTGATIERALLGTFLGIVAGGLLVVLLDESRTALWALLPFACGLAAYAPRAVSFTAGQAAFSMTVLILFNLLEPAGWQVGLVRIEDVAIGAVISLAVGVLLWPRGASAVLRRSIGDGYERAGAYLQGTIDALLGGARQPPADLADAAFRSGQVLDATVRDYLAERGSSGGALGELGVLSTGARRIRSIARLLEGGRLGHLRPIDERLPHVAAAAADLRADTHRRCAWYAGFGRAIADGGAVPVPEPGRDLAPDRLLFEDGNDGVLDGLAIAWTHRHLRVLRELEPLLAEAGAALPRR